MHQQHLGEGNNYIDRDGHSRQYTVIDHSKKGAVGFTDSEDTEKVKKNWLKCKKDRIKEILAISPTLADYDKYNHLIFRGEAGIRWNKEAVALFVLSEMDKSFGDLSASLYRDLKIAEGTWWT